MNFLRPLALSLAIASSAALLRAADAPATAEPPPTEITSVALEMWSTDTEIHAIFTGNVTVTGNQMKLTCDRLEIIAARVGDKEEITGKLDRFKYLLATGKVNIIQGDREANCGRAEVFPSEERIILTENPVVTDHSNDIVATGEPLILMRGERRVRGDNVKFTAPAIRDLGFDKKQPAPTPAAPTPANPQQK